MSATFENNIFKKRPEEFIRHAMTEAQIDKFWQSSAMDWLRKVMSGNRYFVSHVVSVTINRDKLGYCQKLLAAVEVSWPDNGKTDMRVITYTFDRKTHRVTIN